MKKQTTKSADTGASLHYREVICPFCGHRFMTMAAEATDGIYYDHKEQGRIGQRIVCPSCGEKFAMLNGKLEGVFEDNLPEGAEITREIYL